MNFEVLIKQEMANMLGTDWSQARHTTPAEDAAARKWLADRKREARAGRRINRH